MKKQPEHSQDCHEFNHQEQEAEQQVHETSRQQQQGDQSDRDNPLVGQQADSGYQEQRHGLFACLFDTCYFHRFSFKMNNPIGMCFPDFIGPCLLDCRFAQGPDGKNTGAERG